jgi:hypothetical protein
MATISVEYVTCGIQHQNQEGTLTREQHSCKKRGDRFLLQKVFSFPSFYKVGETFGIYLSSVGC